MATEAQVIANRANASKSTGPRTEAGKARSSRNATAHGLAGDHLPEDLRLSDVYHERHQQLETEFKPDTPYLRQSLDLAVGAYIQSTIAFDMLNHEYAKQKHDAENGWESTRDVEALALFAKIGTKPTETVAELKRTKAGCLLLIEYWTRLKNIAAHIGPWKDDHIAAAFDLMGVPKRFRDDTTQVTHTECDRARAIQQALAETAIAKLEGHIVTSAASADEFARISHLHGPVGPLTANTKLLMRYYNEATRRYLKHMKPLLESMGKTTSKGTRREQPTSANPQTVPILSPVTEAQVEESPQPAPEVAVSEDQVYVRPKKPLILLEFDLFNAVGKILAVEGKPHFREVCQEIRNEYAEKVADFLERTGKTLDDLPPALSFVFTNFKRTDEDV